MATDFKQLMTGVTERRLDTDFDHLRIHYSADPEKDDRWAARLSAKYGGRDSPKWRREFEIDYTAVQGQRVYPMMYSVHIIDKIMTNDWAVYRIIDHGIRHPTVCLWVGVNRAGDRHVFREYFMTNKTIAFNCEEILRRTPDKPVISTYIDPATRQRVASGSRDLQPISVLSLYNTAFGFGCVPADNSRVGYDRVREGLLSVLARKALVDGAVDEDTVFAKEYFKEFDLSVSELLEMSSRPSLTFSNDCPRCYVEMRNLRFKEISGDVTQNAAPEEMMDKDDDGPDCVRYAMMSKLRFVKSSLVAQPGSHVWCKMQQRSKGNSRHARRN